MRSDGVLEIGGSDTVAEITAIEVELDALAESAERCRKMIGAARAFIVAGTVLLASAVWRVDATSLVSGIAAILGGLAIAGSTRTTRAGVLTRIIDAETRRAMLIDTLDISDLTPPAVRWI